MLTLLYSQYKKKRKLLNDIFLGVIIIDCKNDSISVALPFNKELYIAKFCRRVDSEL